LASGSTGNLGASWATLLIDPALGTETIGYGGYSGDHEKTTINKLMFSFYANSRPDFGTEYHYTGFQLEEDLVDDGTATPTDFITPHRPSGIYSYSSFPNDLNYMTGLQGKTSPAANTLARPIANQFTGFVVARTNLVTNSQNYKAEPHWHASWPYKDHTLFSLGEPSDDANGKANSGYYDFKLTSSTAGTGNSGMIIRTQNSLGYSTQTFYDYPDQISFSENADTSARFKIMGISERADIWTDAPEGYAEQRTGNPLTTFHFNGRRSDFINAGYSGQRSPNNTTMDGLKYEDQLNLGATFSIGATKTQNSTSYIDSHSWFDGDIAEILWFNEQLPNTSIAMVEGYLAHKYGIQDDLIHKDGDNAANTISHQWNFTSSQDGWDVFGDSLLTTNPTDLYFDGTTVPHYMDTDISHNPIDGAGFTKMKIRMKRPTSGGDWDGKLYWTAVGDPNQDLSSGYNITAIPSDPGSSFVDIYVDLSSNANWTQKMINKLRLSFTAPGSTGSATYNIDEITVHNDIIYHPFKYEPPLEVGFSNTWFKGY
jgi:hypothetical protein